MKTVVFGAVLLLASTLAISVEAQGVVRGAHEGAAAGERVAGPVGTVVGGAVGGVVGGVAGGVKGVLGIPQRTGVRRATYRYRHSRRGRSVRRR